MPTLPPPAEVERGAFAALNTLEGWAGSENFARRMGAAAVLGLTEGIIWNSELGICIPFQYHPDDITETKAMGWNKYTILGVGQPLLAYGGGDTRGMRFRILLDAHASPRPTQNVEEELRVIRTLTVPFDVSGKPTMKVPEAGVPPLSLARAPKGPGRPVGVPPVVKIAVGGRVIKGVISNLEIQEVLHGTTLIAKPFRACTRAWVSFEFIVIEDSRMLVHWAKHQPTGPAPVAGGG